MPAVMPPPRQAPQPAHGPSGQSPVGGSPDVVVATASAVVVVVSGCLVVVVVAAGFD